MDFQYYFCNYYFSYISQCPLKQECVSEQAGFHAGIDVARRAAAASAITFLEGRGR